MTDEVRVRATDRRSVADDRGALDARRQHEEGDRDPDDVRALHRRRAQRLAAVDDQPVRVAEHGVGAELVELGRPAERALVDLVPEHRRAFGADAERDRKSTRLNSSHMSISYAVFCLKKKKLTR